MSTESAIRDRIDDAATTVGSLWPVHSFVTANPLSGFEDEPFDEAIDQATALLGGRGYPSPETFATALDRGQIDPRILQAELADAGYEDSPETLLDRMADAADAANADDAAGEGGDGDAAAAHVDRVLAKWLSAFLEEGSAHWSMPNREAGFYTAFRGVADHDGDIPDEGIMPDLPETPIETIETVPAGEAFDALSDADPAPYALVLDGQLTQRVLDVAAQRGVEQIVARSAGEMVKTPVDVRVRTIDQFAAAD